MNRISEIKEKIFRKIFSIQTPQIIIVAGGNRNFSSEAIFSILKNHFNIRKISGNYLPIVKKKKEILIFDTDFKDDSEKFIFLIRNSRKPILVLTRIDDGRDSENTVTLINSVKYITENAPEKGALILDFDDEEIRKIKDKPGSKSISFGFENGSDIQASDIKTNDEINFKVNYRGSLVPVWLEKSSNKDQISGILSAIAVGLSLGLNLVEISQDLKK